MGACISIIINACKEVVLSAIPSTQLVPDSEQTAPSAMSSTGVPYSGEMPPSTMSVIPSMQPSVLCAIPSTQLVTDSQETDASAVSSTLVPDSGEMAPSAMSSILSTQQSTTGSVASTSSSIENASGCGKYEVFINHRGIDTKDSLASTIYHRLDSIGVRAFFDREELEAGEEFPNAIKEAIESALVHIAIFSPKYAESRWCLHELTLMRLTGKKIIPIFYNVKPSVLQVGHGSGDYFEAFNKHAKRYMAQELDEWKTALSEASYIKGYEFNEHQKDEGRLVEKIVENVEEEIKKMAALHVAKYPVGLCEAIEHFQNFVESTQCAQRRQNVKIVGIVGLGGCGKTTLAAEYFNQKRSSYKESSFLFDVRSVAAKNSLHDLQKQLLKDLVHIKNANFHNTLEGKRTLEGRVRSVKALIVLDDVDHINQIEALLPLEGNLQTDSLIIVTTRDSGVITSSASLSPSVSVSVYKKGSLSPVHAKQLFCWHAFRRKFSPNGFEDLANQFSTACQGLPLSLKVLGAQLCGNRNRGHWKSLLHKISQILPDDIKQILKVSYDALDEQQQQMFLDVACFFIGEPIDTTISIWDGSSSGGVLWSGAYDFQILVNKCLVEVVEDQEVRRGVDRIRMHRIRIHDHLRDLGREIAIIKTPSRFWSYSQFDNSQRPLEERLPMRGIMAATGSSWGYCNWHYEPPFEECMQLLKGHSTSRSKRLTPSALGLQLLVVKGDYFKEEFAGLSEELIWLRWYDFSHEKLPPWLSTRKLRVLELYEPERLVELWGPNDLPPSQLRELIVDMSGPMQMIPKTIVSLQMIPKTIGFLKHLKKIVLNFSYKWTTMMSSLPEEFCLLESLEHLELRLHANLSSLPTNFGNLRKLKHIDLQSCERLAALPVSFKQLTELQYLDLSYCSNLELEKDILENITKLEILRLRGCRTLQQLPSGITRQIYLRELNLSHSGLRELPADIHRLARLELLEIGSWSFTAPHDNRVWIDDDGVEYLPKGFGQLVNLRNLKIDVWPIRELTLVNPEERYSKKPTNHVDSSMFKFPRLKLIDLSTTKVSTIWISEDCCPCLEDLHLFGNHDLMEIKALPTTLKRVDILDCEKLENIRCLAGLVKLQGLKIKQCPGLVELPRFADLVELQRLNIYDCPLLHKLPSFESLVELRDFSIAKCPQLDELPSFACCTCLQELEVRVSHRITKIDGLEELRSLERLRLETYCKVPGLKNQDKLTTLQIRSENRSVIETCIPPNILKRACTMGIVGRAVEDVESVVGSLSFPNFTVVDKLHRVYNLGYYNWEMKAPVSNASCVIVCFVISCRSKKGYIKWYHHGHVTCFYVTEFDDSTVGWDRIVSPLEGKQVYIGVYPQGFHFKVCSEREFLTISTFGVEDIEIKKGIAVIMRNGEEDKASKTLHNHSKFGLCIGTHTLNNQWGAGTSTTSKESTSTGHVKSRDMPNPIISLDTNFEGSRSQHTTPYFHRRSFQVSSRSRMDDDSFRRQPKLERNFSVSDGVMLGRSIERTDSDNSIKSASSDDGNDICRGSKWLAYFSQFG